MFLSDYSEFALPLAIPNKIGNHLSKIGNTKVGNVFLKKANQVIKYDDFGNVIKNTRGIGNSGRTIRKTPLAAIGLGAAGYGAYRTKKVYDKYKPEITMGRKIMRNYNNFKKTFDWS